MTRPMTIVIAATTIMMATNFAHAGGLEVANASAGVLIEPIDAHPPEGPGDLAQSLVPIAELYVDPYHEADCCWNFDITQVWGQPGNTMQIAATVSGATVTTAAAGTLPGTVGYGSGSFYWDAIPLSGGLTPTNPPGTPSGSIYACFAPTTSSPFTVVFRGYDGAGNPCCLAPSEVSLILSHPSCRRKCVDPPDNMVAWWTLDETSGTSSADIAGFPNTGTHVNTPTPLSGQYVANSLSFNGINEYVEVADEAELNFGVGDFSIDAWIRPTNTSGVRIIVDKRVEAAGGVTGYSLFLSSGVLGFQIADGAGSTTCVTSCPHTASCANYSSGATVPLNQWTHVAVTVSRATNGGTFYVNGVQAGSVFNPVCLPLTVTNTNPLRIGSRSSSISGLFSGAIDEVELFNRELGAAEILGLFQAGIAGKCKCVTPPGGMVAWYTGDDTTASDELGNHHAAYVGFPVSSSDSKVGGGAMAFFPTPATYATTPPTPLVHPLNFGVGDFSIDLWVKRSSNIAGVQPLVDKRVPNGVNSAIGYAFFLFNGNLSLQLADSTGHSNYISTLNVPADNNWYFVAVTVDRCVTNGIVMYLDGQAPFLATPTRCGSLNNTAGLWLGARHPIPSVIVFDGLMDEVELFDRALTATQVQSIYRAGSRGKCKLGACCWNVANSCCCTMETQPHCTNTLGGNWGGIHTVCGGSCCCFPDIPCETDFDVLTCEQYLGEFCAHTPNTYGNVDCVGGVDVDDVICLLAGFANIDDCPNADISPNCMGNGVVDVDDLIEVLDAFAGGPPPCGE